MPPRSARPDLDVPPVARADAPRTAPARVRTERLAVCPECDAFVRGEGPVPVRGAPERREIERGVARLGASGGARAALRATGVALGCREKPCACCRRPSPGPRVALERTVIELTAPA